MCGFDNFNIFPYNIRISYQNNFISTYHLRNKRVHVVYEHEWNVLPTVFPLINPRKRWGNRINFIPAELHVSQMAF